MQLRASLWYGHAGDVMSPSPCPASAINRARPTRNSTTGRCPSKWFYQTHGPGGAGCVQGCPSVHATRNSTTGRCFCGHPGTPIDKCIEEMQCIAGECVQCPQPGPGGGNYVPEGHPDITPDPPPPPPPPAPPPPTTATPTVGASDSGGDGYIGIRTVAAAVGITMGMCLMAVLALSGGRQTVGLPGKRPAPPHPGNHDFILHHQPQVRVRGHIIGHARNNM